MKALKDSYFPRCGQHIKNRLQNEKQESCIPAFIRIIFSKNYKLPEWAKKLARNSLAKNSLALILTCFFGFIFIISTTYVIVSDYHQYGNSSDSHVEVPKERNIQVCEQIATKYNRSHIDIEDIYDCRCMAQDVWDILEAKGINARIAVGDFEHGTDSIIEGGKSVHQNLDFRNSGIFATYNYTCEDTGRLNSSMINNLTHAWVMAEVSPGDWLAIECTGGYIASCEEDRKYYRGLTFSNPKNYRIFLDLYSSWQNQIKDYENEQSCCNELLNAYNSANNSEQSAMKESVESEENRLREKERAFLKTDSELQTLLRCG